MKNSSKIILAFLAGLSIGSCEIKPIDTKKIDRFHADHRISMDERFGGIDKVISKDVNGNKTSDEVIIYSDGSKFYLDHKLIPTHGRVYQRIQPGSKEEERLK